MKIVSIVGKKNTGKTSLTVKVIEELTKRGYNVASIKHSQILIPGNTNRQVQIWWLVSDQQHSLMHARKWT